MPTATALRFLPRFFCLLLPALLSGQTLTAQVTPRQGHLTAPQTPARASEKMTIYNGFSIPAGGGFEGELIGGAVNPPVPSTLTVSANVTIRAGETTPLTASAAPLVGNALSFDGVNDFVQIGDRPALKMTTALTLEAWIYPTGPGSDATGGGIILNKEGEYQLARFADGTIRWTLANTTPGWQWVNTGIITSLNAWSHVAVTYQAGLVKAYLNGTLLHNYTGSGTIGDFHTTMNDFRIGGRQGSNQFFRGTIDEVRVWNVALTEAQVQARYQRTLVPTDAADAAGLAGYWPLDEPLDSHLAGDRSAGANTGTLFNLPRRVRSNVPFTAANRVIQWVQSDAQGNPVAGAVAVTGPRLEVSPTQTSHYKAYSAGPDGLEEAAVVTVTVLPALAPLPQVCSTM